MSSADAIIYYRIFGIPVLLYVGGFALLSILITAAIALRRVTRSSIRWHHRMAFLSIGLALLHGTMGLLGEFRSNGFGSRGHPEGIRSLSGPGEGRELFAHYCSRCHPDGGNTLYPDMPLKGSRRLSDLQTFKRFIRDPRMPDGSGGLMPAFSEEEISDRQAEELYRFIISEGVLKGK
ncbi:MAG TPA: cytochrome c [Thermodesulfovibrionales bacterium]|nr:cytochrome c [Thermodesulfovibrionales bacterium]